MILVTDVLMGAHPSKCSWKLVAKSWMTKDIDIDRVNKICYTLMRSEERRVGKECW